MKKAIGILHFPDNEAESLTIYYNGPQGYITAENSQTVENMEYRAEDESDAREAARAMYRVWPWIYEELR